MKLQRYSQVIIFIILLVIVSFTSPWLVRKNNPKIQLNSQLVIASSTVDDGNDANPKSLESTESNEAPKTATSGDGKYLAYTKDAKHIDYDPIDTINYNEIWLKDIKLKKEYTLVKSGKIKDLKIKNVTESNFPFDEIRNLNIDDFSNDGNLLYFRTAAWTTSAAVFSVDIKTKEIRFVTDSNYLEVIKTGKYKGMLITMPHRYYNDKEGSYDYYYIFDPRTGKDLKELGEVKIITD
jgi:hypothetical protein